MYSPYKKKAKGQQYDTDVFDLVVQLMFEKVEPGNEKVIEIADQGCFPKTLQSPFTLTLLYRHSTSRAEAEEMVMRCVEKSAEKSMAISSILFVMPEEE